MAKSDDSGVTFLPHLAGDQVSIKNKTEILQGLTLATTRDDILFGIVRGLIQQLEEGMATYRQSVGLAKISIIREEAPHGTEAI